MRGAILRAAVATVCVLTIAGCGHKRRRPANDGYSSGNEGYSPAPAAMPATASWNGTWQTSFGRLAMEQQNDGTVIGVYKYVNAGREVVGALKGPMEGATIRFKWAESEGGAGTGHGTFYMNADGNSFGGTWGTGESDTSGGEWKGQRLQ